MEKGAYHPSLGITQTQRDLHPRYDDWKGRIGLALVRWLAPAIRGWHRNLSLRCLLPPLPALPHPGLLSTDEQWTIEDVERDKLIGTLLEVGWKPCESHELWDLTKEGTRVLFATEKGPKGAKRSLVRVDGDASLVRAGLTGI